MDENMLADEPTMPAQQSAQEQEQQPAQEQQRGETIAPTQVRAPPTCVLLLPAHRISTSGRGGGCRRGDGSSVGYRRIGGVVPHEVRHVNHLAPPRTTMQDEQPTPKALKAVAGQTKPKKQVNRKTKAVSGNSDSFSRSPRAWPVAWLQQPLAQEALGKRLASGQARLNESMWGALAREPPPHSHPHPSRCD